MNYCVEDYGQIRAALTKQLVLARQSFFNEAPCIILPA